MRHERHEFTVLDENRRTLSVYVQDKITLIDKLNITTGLRFDDYRGFGNSFSPRLALLYHWLKNNSFKLMFGRAYRAPSLSDIYDKEGVVSTGNLDLKPVTVITYEFSYLHTKNNNSVIFTGFYNNYRDVISTRKTVSGDNVFENVYDNQILGVELDLRFSFNENWSSSAGFTRILATCMDAPADISFSQPETLAPKTYGNLVLNYRRNN